jgi:hypothetical protein
MDLKFLEGIESFGQVLVIIYVFDQSSLKKFFMPKMPSSCVYFARYSDFSVRITQRTVGELWGGGWLEGGVTL